MTRETYQNGVEVFPFFDRGKTLLSIEWFGALSQNHIKNPHLLTGNNYVKLISNVQKIV